MNAATAGDIDLRLLTPIVKRMVRAIGVDDTITILRARGGTDIKLPHGQRRGAVSHDTVVSQLIGAVKAAAFYHEFADGRYEMTLPKVDRILMQYRNAEIRRLHFDEGKTLSTLALQAHLTERHVWNIVHSQRWPRWREAPDTRQRDLFGT